tara:strand:- start:7246 stop:7560 length:315 start_codon:yes stop_codon:yes gene_type:complete
MIENLETEREYDILGFKLKVNPEEEGEQSKVTSQRVIEFVQKKISELKDKYPQLSDAQIAVLLAMESSRERLEIEEDFKQSVEFYDNQAQRVKDLVETIKPSYN